MLFRFSIIFLILTIFSSKINCDPDDETVEITIKHGTILGKKIHEQDQYLGQFLGIPYAKPPIGDLRFQRPKPLEQFEQQPLKAFDWASNCPQLTAGDFNNLSRFLSDQLNEDCLYLNIWTPNFKIDVDAEQNLLPVIFYIHGGGLLFGGASYHFHDGRTLASLANAVVVTINYRLSTLGLFYSDQIETNIKGNMAFWDQTLAMEWVQENIKYFGGNPKQVTLIGESAGSWSVSAHILSPVSRNLFKNAYLMSGSIQNLVSTVDVAKKKWLRLLEIVGCASKTDESINQKMVDCMAKIPIEQITALPFIDQEDRMTPLSIVDGEFFPEHPLKMLQDGNFKKGFNLLFSTMEDEGSSLLKLALGSNELMEKYFGGDYPEPITYDEAQRLFSTVLENFTGDKLKKTSLNTLRKIYFNGLNPMVENQNLYRQAIGKAFGDVFLSCPTIDFAQKIFKRSHELHGQEQQVQVYQLYNTYKMGSIKDFCKEWAGPCHADDLFYFFGLPLRNPENYLQRERDISRELISIIKSFIRSGHPDKNEQPEWQSYMLEQDQIVAPYYELSNDIRTYRSYGFNLKQIHCQFF